MAAGLSVLRKTAELSAVAVSWARMTLMVIGEFVSYRNSLFLFSTVCVSILIPRLAIGYDIGGRPSHFMATRLGKNDSAQYSAVWRDGVIVYYLYGNGSDRYRALIDDFMNFVSQPTGLKLLAFDDISVAKGPTQAGRLGKTFSGAIYIKIDTNIFDELVNNQSALRSSGFSSSDLEKMVDKYRAAGPGASCISGVGSNLEGYAVLGYLLSDGKSTPCIKEALYQIFGVAHIDNYATAFTYLCMLYRARNEGMRELPAIVANTQKLFSECAPTHNEQ
jgi:hypothetical protein